jgi:hypothetical protein
VLLEPSITEVRAEAERLVRDVSNALARAKKSFCGLRAPWLDRMSDRRGGLGCGEAEAFGKFYRASG